MVERTADGTVRSRDATAQDSAYKTEHIAAWAMVFASLLLGAIGVCRAFGLIGGGAEAGEITTGAPGTQAVSFPAIWDGVVWLLPAIAAALLAMALHRNDHHRMLNPELLPDDEEGLWKGEHALALVMALGAIACGVLGVLVGFDVFDRGNDQPDSIPWHLAAVGLALLTNALHAVRHHQFATDEDYIVRVVERRVATPGQVTTTGTVRETGTEYRT
jgi:hypothetical protein